MINPCFCLSGPPTTKITVEEDHDVVLPCSFGSSDITNKIFDWKILLPVRKEVFLYQSGSHYNNGLEGQDEQFKGRVFHFPDSLRVGNASIRINKAKVDDSGNYTCDFPNDGGRRSQIELLVGEFFYVTSKDTYRRDQFKCSSDELHLNWNQTEEYFFIQRLC